MRLVQSSGGEDHLSTDELIRLRDRLRQQDRQEGVSVREVSELADSSADNVAAVLEEIRAEQAIRRNLSEPKRPQWHLLGFAIVLMGVAYWIRVSTPHSMTDAEADAIRAQNHQRMLERRKHPKFGITKSSTLHIPIPFAMSVSVLGKHALSIYASDQIRLMGAAEATAAIQRFVAEAARLGDERDRTFPDSTKPDIKQDDYRFQNVPGRLPNGFYPASGKVSDWNWLPKQGVHVLVESAYAFNAFADGSRLDDQARTFAQKRVANLPNEMKAYYNDWANPTQPLNPPLGFTISVGKTTQFSGGSDSAPLVKPLPVDSLAKRLKAFLLYRVTEAVSQQPPEGGGMWSYSNNNRVIDKTVEVAIKGPGGIQRLFSLPAFPTPEFPTGYDLLARQRQIIDRELRALLEELGR